MKRIKCEECGGRIIKKKTLFTSCGIKAGIFPVEVCTKCKEEVFDEKIADKIIKKLNKN